jgi:hypothetical protein
MKVMAALAILVFSTGLAYGAVESEKKEPSPTVAGQESKRPAAAKSEKKEPSPAQQAQREKMKACNAEAGQKELKGEERKKFMSGCLKGTTPPGKGA